MVRRALAEVWTVPVVLVYFGNTLQNKYFKRGVKSGGILHSAIDEVVSNNLPNGWMDQDETWHAVGLGAGHIVLDGDPAPPPHKRGQSPLPNFWPRSIVSKRLDGSRYHLVGR